MKYYIFLLIALICFACDDSDEYRSPEINTISVTNKNDSIQLLAEIVLGGSLPINKHGFVISERDEVLGLIPSILEMKQSESSEFRMVIPDTLKEGKEYIIKAFCENDKEIVYGDGLDFIGTEKRPDIFNYEPKSGKAGEFIKLYGRNLDCLPYELKVKFGDIEAKIVSQSTDRIVVEIPEYSVVTSCKLLVKVKAYEFKLDDYFELYGPKIKDFDPVEGMGDIVININGSNFSETAHHNIVKIGSQKADVIKASENHLKIKCNTMDIIPGKYQISVNSSDLIAYSSKQYNVNSPWERTTDFPEDAPSRMTTFTIGDCIYYCCGDYKSNKQSNSIWEFNTISTKWVKKNDFPGEARYSAFGFSIGNKGYMGGGIKEQSGNGTLSDFWEYDPSNDTWLKKMDIPNGGIAEANAISHKGKGYVVLGLKNWYGSGYKTDFEVYDPATETWNVLSDFEGSSRRYSKVAIVNDEMYLFGGSNYNTSFEKDIWKYDFKADTWAFVNFIDFAPMHAFNENNKCYIISALDMQLYEFDILNNQLIKMHIFPGEFLKYGASSVIKNDNIYFGLSDQFNANSDLWIYPLTND
ncbi:Kelch repeat-containing protein [Labilibaculum euxinus]